MAGHSHFVPLNLLSLDLSLRATGFCELDGSTGTLPCSCKGMERLAWIRDQVLDLVFVNQAHVVVLEGYSFGSKGQAVVNIGELGGVVRLALYELQVPVAEVPPACLKKYATGRGNAGKDDVLQAGVMRSGHTFRDNNACDAWWLHQMALAYYDPDSDLLVKVPAAHRVALDKVPWPVMAGKGKGR